MAQDGYKRCPVSFNLRDPLQRKLYEHTRQFTNFSAYVKALILADYIRKQSDSGAN